MLTRRIIQTFSSPNFTKRINLTLLTAFAVLVLWPITESSLTADDIPNATLRALFSNQPGSQVSNFFSHIYFYTKQWINSEGRFFPMSVIYGSTVHFIFQGVGLYKTYLALLGFLNTYLLYRFIREVLSEFAGLIAGLTFLSTYVIRYRDFHDGVTSFAGVVPFTLLLSLICLNSVVTRSTRRKTFVVIALLCWLLASLTYEHVATFIVGIFIFISVYAPRNTRKALLLGVSAISVSQFVLTFYLRQRASDHLNWAYQLRFDSVDFVRTSSRQLIAALPSSQMLFSQPRDIWTSEHLLTAESLLLLFGLASMMILLFRMVKMTDLVPRGEKYTTKVWPLVLVGLNMWITPALITGATPRWQSELPVGQGYLCVTLQSAGFSILAAAASVKLRHRYWLGQLVLPGVVLLAVSSAVYWNWNYN